MSNCIPILKIDSDRFAGLDKLTEVPYNYKQISIEGECVMNSPPKSKPTAPYAPASALFEFFDRMRHINVPDKVDKKLLETYGIAPHNEYSVLSTLKHLGLTDDEGTPTDEFSLVHVAGAGFEKRLRELVQHAYEDFFETYDRVPDDKELITTFFRVNYRPATAVKATTLFLALCEAAGIEVPPELMVSAPAKAETPRKARKLTSAIEQPRPTPSPESAQTESLMHTYIKALIEDMTSLEVGPDSDATVISEVAKIRKEEREHIEELLASLGVLKQNQSVSEDDDTHETS